MPPDYRNGGRHGVNKRLHALQMYWLQFFATDILAGGRIIVSGPIQTSSTFAGLPLQYA